MSHHASRRRFLQGLAAGAVAATVRARATGPMAMRPVGSSSTLIPAIGMGTWLTFDVGDDPSAIAQRTRVLREFFARGGRLIDSSPMYRRAEAVVGRCLAQLDGPPVFAATKVWKYGRDAGLAAMEQSRQLWGVERIDLMQVHNLLDVATHLETLVEMREQGAIRFIGITTSHGRRHDEFVSLMRKQPQIDAVQFTYNVTHRAAEQQLLPAALDAGKAVIINRPLDGGRLFERVASQPLPGFAAEIGCANWAQIFLKFVISHPAVTCAIPATRQVAHMRENMGALYGPLPDAEIRRRIVRAVEGA